MVLRFGVEEPPVELGPAVLQDRRDAFLTISAELRPEFYRRFLYNEAEDHAATP